MADQLTKDSVLQHLSRVLDPETGRDLVSLSYLKKVNLKDDGQVELGIEVPQNTFVHKDKLRKEIEAGLEKLEGFDSVYIEWGMQQRGAPQANPNLAPNLKKIIAVSSGKGGVGKSTVAANLAVSIAQTGARVGLLDSDIYGPNMPTIMGVHGQPAMDGDKIVPMRNHGVSIMSMGFLVDPENPVIWRGPMLHKAIRQFFVDVAWGELDFLIVDLPPGTGDVQLSLFQTVPIAGVVVVTTPQEVALADVRKGIVQWQRFQVPILGVVENMSYFISPTDGSRHEIFAHGGGKKAAEHFDIPFLGEIPLATEIRQGSDDGTPMMASAPDSEIAKAYRSVAEKIAAQPRLVGQD